MIFAVYLDDLLQSESHMPGTVSKVAARENWMSLALASFWEPVTSTQLRLAYQSGPLASWILIEYWYYQKSGAKLLLKFLWSVGELTYSLQKYTLSSPGHTLFHMKVTSCDQVLKIMTNPGRTWEFLWLSWFWAYHISLSSSCWHGPSCIKSYHNTI